MPHRARIPRYLWRVVAEVIPDEGLMEGDFLGADYDRPVIVVRSIDWPESKMCAWFQEAHAAGLITPASDAARAYLSALPRPAPGSRQPSPSRAARLRPWPLRAV